MVDIDFAVMSTVNYPTFVMRYGNMRQTDTAMVSHVINGLVAWIWMMMRQRQYMRV
jgi:hypothetical protein